MDIHSILVTITWIINGFSIVVIIWGVLLAAFRFLKEEFVSRSDHERMRARQVIRASLGSYILLGLEILIAADIIGTIANPTITEILLLAVTVLIRTFISFFLNREIKEAEEFDKQNSI